MNYFDNCNSKKIAELQISDYSIITLLLNVFHEDHDQCDLMELFLKRLGDNKFSYIISPNT